MRAILEPFMLRRVKKDVEKSLPLLKQYVLTAPLTARQNELYEATLRYVPNYHLAQAPATDARRCSF